MDKNNSIRCDVSKCIYNNSGENCKLDSIKVTCADDGRCTRCQSFLDKRDW